MDLKVWWDEDADDATIVRSPDELDAVLAEARQVDYPVLVELLDAADPKRVILDVGINGDHGVLYYSGGEHPKGVFSKFQDAELSPIETVLYYYMSNDRGFPTSAVMPVDMVFTAAHEYMESGGARPAAIQWQPRSVLTS